MQSLSWSAGTWINPPADSIVTNDGHLIVTCKENSDFWRKTSYGFVHDDAHGLLYDFPENSAVEVSFKLNYDQQFDQAGILVWCDDRNWIKTGVEYADGAPQLGAVVTYEYSDWSVAPVESWMEQIVTIRASRSGDALTVRAKCGDSKWRLVRLAPLHVDKTWRVGLFCCSPTRSGLKIEFSKLEIGPSDDSLH